MFRTTCPRNAAADRARRGAAWRGRLIVTTCARCGLVVQPGTPVCPRCGLQLLPPPQGPDGGMAQSTPPMPEWMRAVQGGGWGAPPGAGGPAPAQAPQYAPGSLSVGSLLSEDALPDWVRGAGDAPAPAAGQAGWGAGVPPAGVSPAPAPGGWGPPSGGMQPGSPGWGAPPAGPAAPGWGAPPPGGGWGQAPMAPGAAMGNGGASPPGAPPALFDDAALPEWLRSATANQPPMAQPAPYPPGNGMNGGGFFAGGPMSRPQQPPAQMPAPARPYQGGGAGNMPANALFDSTALPTWLGGSGAAPEPAAPANALGGDGVSAGSLIDERALPLWLRQEPAAPPVSNAPPAGAVSEWLAAPVTDEPLPSWLNQVYSSAQVPRVASLAPAPSPFGPPSRPSGPPPASPWGPPGGPASAPVPGSMSVGHLVEETALPDWLRAQAGPIGAPPPSQGPNTPPGGPPFGAAGAPAGGGMGWSAAGAAAPIGSTGGWDGGPGAPAPAPSWSAPAAAGGAPERFAASDLIDPGAMPSWVQQEQAQPEFSSATGWTNRQAAATPPGLGQPSGSNGGMAPPNVYQPESVWAPTGAAADDASLPPWLRTPAAAIGVTSGGHAARPAHSSIPNAELPPWLRAGGGQEAYPGGAGGAPYPPDASAAPGWPADGSQMAGPANGKRQAARAPVHYADRFGEERPGPGGRFSYAEDFGNEGNVDGDGAIEEWGFPPEELDEPEPPRKKRRGLFGRK
jgi:hypothetical protein